MINVLVNNGANHECGIILKTTNSINNTFGMSASKNVFLKSLLPLCPNPLPISYPSKAQKNKYKKANKVGIDANWFQIADSHCH